MMPPAQFMARMFLAALLPLLVALPALAFGLVKASSPAPTPLAAADDDEERDVVTITIRNGRFNPSTATVKPGQTVKWVNNDDRDYSLAATGKKDSLLKGLSSGTLKPGKSWTFKIPDDQPSGTYPYACKLRPRAKGTLRVG